MASPSDVPDEQRPDAAANRTGEGRKPPGIRTRVRRLAVIALLTYVGVCMLTALLQSRLIYFPTRGYSNTPADVALVYDEMMLTTADGVSIAAWYAPHPTPRGSVIFCHGNAGNISDRLHSIKLLHGMGLNVLIFDYRGYGRSEGKPSEAGTYEDAEAAWRYLTETRGEAPNRVVLFGRSLGGAVAIELASRRSLEPHYGPEKPVPAALVVESTFTSLVDVGQLHYRWLPVRLLLTYRYDSIGKVPQIMCPKLFVHGRDDELIPITMGRRLYEAAAEPKQFLQTPGGHNEGGFTFSPAFTDRLNAFLVSTLSAK